MNERTFRILLGLGVAGLIIGTVGIGARLLFGHADMAYGSYVPWGLWIAFDLIFLGLTSGGYFVIVLAHGFGMKRFEHLAPLAVFTLLLSLLCEGIIVSLDLGHPLRVYRFFVTPSFTSMLTWLVLFIILMWLNYLPMFYFLTREKFIRWSQEPERRGRTVHRFLAGRRTAYTDADRERDRGRVRALALISIPVGFLFFSVQGMFFAVVLNRPLWNSPFTPVLFMAAAFLSGVSLITALSCIHYRNSEMTAQLGRIVRGLLVVFLILEAVQFFVGYRSGSPGAVAALNLIAFGPQWWAFWIVHIIAGGIVPLYLLSFHLRDSRYIAGACILIVITFIAVRYNAVVPDLSAYNLEGLDRAFINARLSASYAPNIYEWLVSVWVVSLWLVLFLLSTRWLPLISTEKGEEQHAS